MEKKIRTTTITTTNDNSNNNNMFIILILVYPGGIHVIEWFGIKYDFFFTQSYTYIALEWWQNIFFFMPLTHCTTLQICLISIVFYMLFYITMLK